MIGKLSAVLKMNAQVLLRNTARLAGPCGRVHIICPPAIRSPGDNLGEQPEGLVHPRPTFIRGKSHFRGFDQNRQEWYFP